MSFDGVLEALRAMPPARGRFSINTPLAPRTWFRVGGPATALFSPADTQDLADFLRALPADIPVLALGLASNTLIRDGGFPGVIIRLAKGFTDVAPVADHTLRCGAGLPDVRLASAAADAQVAGLSFYRGIPGAIGGALRMNAGAHGSETKDVLVAAEGVTRAGEIVRYDTAAMGFTYRHCAVPGDVIFTHAEFRGMPGAKGEIEAEMAEVAAYRQEHQPTRERTGGSTFKNPPGESAWRLVDAAGCRGMRVGGAQVSEKHCNFLIASDGAVARDIETLGETVRARVLSNCGISLQWEIKRVGDPLPGAPVGEALAL